MNSKSAKFFYLIGGRKQFNGYLATLLLTVMALLVRPPYPEYSFSILAALGLTSGLVALEDREKQRFSQKTQISEVSASTQPDGSLGELKALNVSQAKGAETNGNSNPPVCN